MNAFPRFMIAAAHKSSGKTVLSAGLAAVLKRRGHDVATFKKGPDYIDPMWLTLASGNPSYNLDFNTMTRQEIRERFLSRAAGRDISLVEANKGLFDGVDPAGADCNAALAKLLDLPVVLVIDTKGMTRGIAPLLLGYGGFDPDVRITGVILNRTGGERHERKLREAVEGYTDFEVIGAVRLSADLDISERHLGLITPGESDAARGWLSKVADRIQDCVEINTIETAANFIPSLPQPVVSASLPVKRSLRIGITRDEAFGFYYADDLEEFASQGAELVPIDFIRDRELPAIDGLVIGGGFPETRIAELSANVALRDQICAALENGLPAYAECGGLMYLCRSLQWDGQKGEMAGFIEGDAVMHPRPQGRGYVRYNTTADNLWGSGQNLPAHEFHYASIESLDDRRFGREVRRGHGVDGTHDAIVKHNTMAGFIHLRHCDATPWVTQFLNFVESCRRDG